MSRFRTSNIKLGITRITNKESEKGGRKERDRYIYIYIYI